MENDKPPSSGKQAQANQGDSDERRVSDRDSGALCSLLSRRRQMGARLALIASLRSSK